MKKPAQQKSNRQQNRKGNGQIEQNKMVIEQEHGMNKQQKSQRGKKNYGRQKWNRKKIQK